MTELEKYIKSYFSIDNTNLSKIANLFGDETLSKGDFYLHQDSTKSKLSFIKSGYMRIYANLDGKEVTQWISSQGEFVTELGSLIFSQPSRFNIEALTDCEIYTISKHDYDRINTLIPEWNQIEKLFIAKCFTMVENRVFSFLSMSAEERYHNLFSLNKSLFNEISLQYIASMLGMTPETLSRIRKKSIS